MNNPLKPFISPHTHCETAMTGSTIGKLVGQAAKLGRSHFSYTDHNTFSGLYKAYNAAKKKGMGFIPGVELYFMDDNCDIIQNTYSQFFKYFKITVFFKDQESFQAIANITRRDRPEIEIKKESQKLFNWKDLEDIAKYNVVFVCSDFQDLIAKNLIVGNTKSAMAIYKKLTSIVGKDNLYLTVVPHKVDSAWLRKIKIKLANGQIWVLDDNDRVDSNSFKNINPMELHTHSKKHHTVRAITINGIFYKVDSRVESTEAIENFYEIDSDLDLQKRANKFMYMLGKKTGTKVLVSDYAYFSEKSDKVVQDMKLETTKLCADYYMMNNEEVIDYCTNVMGITIQAAEEMITNTLEFAKMFDSFELKYDYRLPKVDGDAYDKVKEIIKNTGRSRLLKNPIYKERLKHEISVLKDNGILDLLPYFLPIRDVLNFYKEKGELTGPSRGCLTGNTKVLTNNGYIDLKDIKIGNKVYSHKGIIRNVINTMQYDINEECLSIKTNFSFNDIVLTKDHKLYGIKRKNTEKYLKHKNSKKKYEFKEKVWEDFNSSDMDWYPAEEFKVGDLLYTSWPKREISTEIINMNLLINNFCNYKTRYIPKIDIQDKDFYYFLGRFIGDGSLKNWKKYKKQDNSVAIHFNSNDKQGINRIFNYLKSIGLNPEIRKNKNLTNVIVRSSVLEQIILYIFPNYRYTSCTKDYGILKSLKNDFLLEVVKGHIDSDGYVGKNQESIDTVSLQCALDIKEVLKYLKIPSAIDVREPYQHTIKGHTFTTKKSYKIRFRGINTKPYNKDSFATEDGYYSTIKEITPKYETKVYDITVEKDHSYTTTNYSVHNSAGGCLLMYLMGITQLDPIPYDLPFERFFSMDRILNNNLPDVDVDLPHRELLVGDDGYLTQVYGDKWGQVSTRSLLKIKSAIKDVSRYLNGRVKDEAEAIAKSLPAPPQGVSGPDAVFGFEDSSGAHVPGLLEQSDALQQYAVDNPNDWNIITHALGVPRQISRHASAFIIADEDLSKLVPMMQIKEAKKVTQWEAGEVEKAGLIKYDFLCVSQLKDIGECLKYINYKNNDTLETGIFRHKDKETYIWDLPIDLEAFADFYEGNTETVFQCNTKSMYPFVRRIKPKNIMDLATILALVRPGPLDFIDPATGRSMAEEYMWRREGKSEPQIKELAELLPDTYGIMCIEENSKVKTKKGNVNIQEVNIGELVQVENGTWKPVTNKWFKGIKETISIINDNGEELKLTKDHKVLTQRGWVEAGHLKTNDLIKANWASDCNIEKGNERDYIIGLLLADGNLTGTSYNISAGTKEQAEKIKDIADRSWNLNSEIFFQTRCWYVRLNMKEGDRKKYNKIEHPLKKYMISEDLDGKDCYSKFWPKKITFEMVRGYLDGDGNHKNRQLKTVNEKLARGLFESLQSLRIKSSLRKEKYWIVNWGKNIDSKIKKNRNSEFKYEKDIFIPKPNWKLKRSDNRRQYFTPKQKNIRPFISLHIAKQIAKDYNFDLDTQQCWSKVKEIKKRKKSKVYDLEIKDIHSFTVGGLVVHNCFQEDITKVAKNLSGFSGPDAEDLRKYMCKKKKKEMMMMKPAFVEGAVKNGHTAELAEAIWDQMETFAAYGFSIIHSVGYAMITYACIFLKYNYKLEWWAAVLSNAKDKEINEELWKYVKDIVAAPDINLSKEHIVIDYKNNKLRSKLSMITGLGEKAITPIMENRPYRDIRDFIEKEVCGQSMANKLTYIGVLDSLFEAQTSELDKLQEIADLFEEKAYCKKVYKKAEELGIEIPLNASCSVSNLETFCAETDGLKRLAGPKKGSIDQKYTMLSSLEEFKMKKSILPSMPLNLMDSLMEMKHQYIQKAQNQRTGAKWCAINSRGKETPFINGKRMRMLDERTINKDFYFAVCAYVHEAKVFEYGKGKKALKIITDVDGYISEKVLWPNYESKELEYPEGLKKGATAVMFFSKKENSPYTNINDIYIVE
jgi:DNA polymerase III alpha subunit